MIALKNNTISTIMSTITKQAPTQNSNRPSRRSKHVRLSQRATKIFQNQEVGNNIIIAIAEGKDKLSKGETIIVETKGANGLSTIPVQLVTVNTHNK